MNKPDPVRVTYLNPRIWNKPLDPVGVTYPNLKPIDSAGSRRVLSERPAFDEFIFPILNKHNIPYLSFMYSQLMYSSFMYSKPP
jgi:hypothetical protein